MQVVMTAFSKAYYHISGYLRIMFFLGKFQPKTVYLIYGSEYFMKSKQEFQSTWFAKLHQIYANAFFMTFDIPANIVENGCTREKTDIRYGLSCWSTLYFCDFDLNAIYKTFWIILTQW